MTAYLVISTFVAGAWYGGAKLVWGDDATHPLSLSRAPTYFRLLDPGLGGPDGRKFPFILPLGAILEAWRLLGIPYNLEIVQPLVVVGLLTASAASMYYLIRACLPSIGALAAFAGGLTYAFNLYAMTTIWSSMSYLAIHYAFLPLVVLMWVTAFRRMTVSWALAAALVWLLALTPAYITTPVAVTDSALFGAVTLAWIVKRRRPRRTLAISATIYGAWVCGSLFWLLPLYLSKASVTASGLSVGDPRALFGENSAPLLGAIRLGGFWGVTATYLEHPYFAWSSYYKHIGLSAAAAIPVLTAIGLLGTFAWPRTSSARLSLPRDERGFVVFAAAVVLVALFLITGTHFPLGGLKGYAVEHLNLQGPFRSVYARFGVYLSAGYAPLVALGVGVVERAVRGLTRTRAIAWIVALAATAAVAVVPAIPMWTGTIMDRSGLSPSRRVTIPDDYARVTSILDSTSGDFDISVFPVGGFGVTTLRWDNLQRGYNGIEPIQLLTGKGVSVTDPTAPYLNHWATTIVRAKRGIPGALELLNARYVVLHLDGNLRYLQYAGAWTGLAVRKVGARLDRVPGTSLVYASTLLRVYSVNTWRPFRLFAVRVHGRHRRVTPFDIRPLRYTSSGYSRYSIDAAQLHRGEVLVVNRPYDNRWTANGIQPFWIAPGLTAFKLPRKGTIKIAFGPERTVRVALLSLPAALGLIVALLVLAHWRERRTRQQRLGLQETS